MKAPGFGDRFVARRVCRRLGLHGGLLLVYERRVRRGDGGQRVGGVGRRIALSGSQSREGVFVCL